MIESIAHDQLRAFVERIERMHEERRAIGDDIKEIYAEAKGIGFDTKALKIVIRKREQDPDKRAELEAMVDIYEAALGMANGTRYHDNDEPHAPAPARESASGVPVPEIPSIEGVSPATEAATDANTGGPDDIVSPELIGTNIESFKTTVGAIPDDSLRADAIALGSDVEPVAPTNVTQLRPEKRITFNDKPHVDCLDPGQCGGFSNLGLCPRCKAVAGGGAAEIEHHGSIGA